MFRRPRLPHLVFAGLAGLAGVAAAAPAAPDLVGDPPYTRLAPDIEFYPQTFALAQDRDGVIYVGASEGVLIFDGARWRLAPLPNEDLVRAVVSDGASRVYVGGYDAFGYLQRDASGREVYHDLAAAFAGQLGGEAFGDIWEIHLSPHGVFFRALRHVFLYEPASGAARLWRHEGRFGAIAECAGVTVLQFRGEGLRRFDGAGWQAVPGSAPLRELAYQLVPMADGALLARSADAHWRRFHRGRVETLRMPPGFPASSDISSAVSLADGTLAMAGVDGAMVFLDPRSGAWRRFRLDPGYLNQVIVAVDGGLLVAGDSSIYRIEWPAAWTVLGGGHGLTGNLHDVVRWGERWLALSGAGVQELVARADGGARFERRDWTRAEAWDLLPLDDRRALLAESYAVMHIADGRASAVTHNALYPRLLRHSRFHPGTVLVGLETGIAVLRQQGGAWRAVLEKNDMAGLRVLSLVETAPGEVWLGSDRGGVWRLRFSEDYRAIAEARQFGEGDGLVFDGAPAATVTQMADGGLVAANTKGMFRFDGTRFAPTDLDGLGPLRAADDWLEPVVAPDGSRWAFSFRHLYREIAGSGWRREDVAGIARGAIEALRFAGGRAILATGNALLTFDPRHAPAREYAPQPRLAAVERADGSGRSLLPVAAPLALAQGEDKLTFRFALPDYRRPEAVRYATRLAGLEAEFSEWTPAATVTYGRLPPGDYRFELQSRDSRGRVAAIAPLAVTILPPWYASAAARALWLLSGAALLWLLTQAAVRLRTRRLAADKARLERQVSERTIALADANRRLEAMAHHDGLTGVANRRSLDAFLDRAWAQAAADARPLALLAIDVDRFKQYNDAHGHLNGDELLMLLVHALARLMPESGLLGRYGGDEFMAVLPGMDAAPAQALAETLRAEAERMQLGTTVSIGVAAGRPAAGLPAAQLVAAADQALYAAKSAGRNCVRAVA